MYENYFFQQMCKSDCHYVPKVSAITPKPNESRSELESCIHTMLCCVALAQLPVIINPWKRSFVFHSLKIVELLGSQVIIAKQGNTKYRWKAIPSGGSDRWCLEFYSGSCETWKHIAWIAVALTDAKLFINTTITLGCFWLTSLFFSFFFSFCYLFLFFFLG